MGFDEAVYKGLACPYCGKITELISASNFYANKPNSKGWIRCCKYCNAHAVCKGESTEAIGSICNKELIEKRNLAKSYVNAICKKKMQFDKSIDFTSARYKLLGWASRELKISPKDLYIPCMNKELCDKYIELMSSIITINDLQKY